MSRVRRFFLRPVVVAVAVAAILGGLHAPPLRSSAKAEQWQAPGHAAVLADATSPGRGSVLGNPRHLFHPRFLPATLQAGDLATRDTHLVLHQTRPGARHSAPRLYRRVTREDSDPPA